MIGIIGAMSVEVEQLKGCLEDMESVRISGITFYCGRLFDQEVVIAACGIGKVAAAVCAQTMILRFSPDMIINTGVAGTLTDRLGVGDIALADFSVEHDMDTSPIGDPVGLISGIDIIKLPCSEKVTRLLAESISRAGKMKCLTGTIASGDQFVSSRERKDFIVSNFGAIACDMECAALAHVCYLNKVEFGAVRAISDNADGESNVDYGNFLNAAAYNAAEAVKYFVQLV